jgi:hypothetical protein
MKYYIGWDVGAWHCSDSGESSKDALVILDENLTVHGVWEGNLSSHIVDACTEAETSNCLLNSLCKLCEVNPLEIQGSAILFAIDTPLGWPDQFRQLLQWLEQQEDFKNRISPPCIERKIENPYLHRRTETELGSGLSTVQDQIGSQSTKALFLLRSIGATSNSPGVWKAPIIKSTFIETYPAPCVRSLDFLSVLKQVKNTENISSVDKFDALVCAALACVFDNRKDGLSVTEPKDDISIEEGWIFVPKKLLPIQVAVSYGRLFENKLPTTSVREVVMNMQLGLVLHSALSKGRYGWNESIVGWLKKQSSLDGLNDSLTGEKLRELFLVLNPSTKNINKKTKKDKIPADSKFDEIAKQVNEILAGTEQP